uniref:Uncharacterized protein n=1 Tax=Balaenoptera musculus TaxID=9771 RepID=A0A8C0CYZ4_BALMU
MSRASLTSSSSWYSASCCCITSRISVISRSLASSIFRNLSRSPATVSSSSRIRSSAAFAWGGGPRASQGEARPPPGLFPAPTTAGGTGQGLRRGQGSPHGAGRGLGGGGNRQRRACAPWPGRSAPAPGGTAALARRAAPAAPPAPGPS